MSSEGDRREDPERKEEEEEEEEFEDANSDLNDMTRPSEWSPGDKVSLIFFIKKHQPIVTTVFPLFRSGDERKVVKDIDWSNQTNSF